MPRRSVLTDSEKMELLKIPSDLPQMSKYYLLSEHDISIIKKKRGIYNKVGFGLILCCMRYPGIAINAATDIPREVLQFIAQQLKIKDFANWTRYFNRETTRWEHISEVKKLFNFRSFTANLNATYLKQLVPLCKKTDKGIIVVEFLIRLLRENLIIIPEIAVLERICSAAIYLGTQEFYSDLLHGLTHDHKSKLDILLTIKPGTKISFLHWLLQPAVIPRPKYILFHIDRLNYIKRLELPEFTGQNVHQGRLIKLSKEGRNMPAPEIQKFEDKRRYATIVAILLETKASIIDEIIELNDKILGNIFNRAKTAYNQEFQDNHKSINETLDLYVKVGDALINAKQNNSDPFQAIEGVISWDEFKESIKDTQDLIRPTKAEMLSKLTGYYGWIKRYILKFLESLEFKPSKNTSELFAAMQIVANMHRKRLRKLPDCLPKDFIKKQWYNLVFSKRGSDKQFYELAVLFELKNSLRSGDIWVVGSRKYKDFDSYLLDQESFNQLKENYNLPNITTCNFTDFIEDRIKLLAENLQDVIQLALKEELIDAVIDDKGLKITTLTSSVPLEVSAFNQKVYSLLPKIKITHLLQEVDSWINYTQEFTHLKNDNIISDKSLLLTVILSDAINLGLTKMAEACPGMTYSKLSSTQAWYIREDNYKRASALITNAQHQQAITKYWGEGNSSSSDGQRFKAGGTNALSASFNPKYGSEPGVTYYSHISDLYAPFYINVITSNIRDSTYVLDGLLYHEADLDIYEHYTDTSGFTDHVFALMHLLGFKFAPRIRDLKDKKIYLPEKSELYNYLSSITGGIIKFGLIERNWEEILRLALSIKNGTVTSSLIIRKLSSYQRKNSLSLALIELGKIERSIFMLEWIKDPSLRRRVQIGLNKGEARHALNRAVHFNRLGEVRDRTFENQMHRASGLNLVVGAIILWNTVYIQQAVDHLRNTDPNFDKSLIKHLSPLGWEHINLTGDYIWSTKIKPGRLATNFLS